MQGSLLIIVFGQMVGCVGVQTKFCQHGAPFKFEIKNKLALRDVCCCQQVGRIKLANFS